MSLDKAINDLRQQRAYAQVLLEGCSIEFGPLSLVDLSTCTGAYAKGYQVHCDTHKVKQDLVYNDEYEAVEEFLELKERLSK